MSNQKQKQKQSDTRTDAEIAKDIVATHGHALLGKVVRRFREQGWNTRIGQYYVDAATDKSREIDLIAERQCNVVTGRGSRVIIDLQLFIECKYITSPAVFWFESIDRQNARRWIESRTGIGSKARNVVSDELDRHHYLKSDLQVAKLFATEGGKGEETEPMFKALAQCLSGYVRRRDHSTVERPHPENPKRRLCYPVILCSSFDRFFRTTISESQLPPTHLDENFMFELHYAYPADGGSKDEYMLVDVVELAKLDEFLGVLSCDKDAVALQLTG
jgi:hypothetical protein